MSNLSESIEKQPTHTSFTNEENNDDDIARSSSNSSLTESEQNIVNINNLTDLPCKSEAYIIEFMKRRLENKKFYTWAGQALIAVHPFHNESPNMNHETPSIDAVIDKAWFNLSRNIGKENQAVVFSGDSGSGKTYSACLALKSIATKTINTSECKKLFWQVWSSVPLLTAFGNASTEHNSNSSRFGKMLLLQFNKEKIVGAKIQTYLLEKSRVTGPNLDEGNFHIFEQILDNLNKQELEDLKLSSTISYKICPRINSPMSCTYNETIKSLKMLQINEIQEILIILAAILNIGNIKFENKDTFFRITQDSVEFLENVADLLKTDKTQLEELLTKRSITPTSSQSKRRLTSYQSPCQLSEECYERLNCLMRYLYDNLFKFIVRKINALTGKEEDKNTKRLVILDIYGFEIFQINSFEQLCINYANERLQQYFVKDYLLENVKQLESDGFNMETIDPSDCSARVSLLDGNISIFSILNEECMVKRFNTDSFINSRLTSSLKNHTYFIACKNDVNEEFTVKHFAGKVVYDSRKMVEKNRDKVPEEMVDFLLNECKFDFLKQIVCKKIQKGQINTLLKKFKHSLDCLMKTLDECDVHYIKCVKPNALQEAEKIDDQFLLMQLKINGIFEILKINFQGYTIKLKLEQFEEMCSINLLHELKEVLDLSLHIGNNFVYLTEHSYLVLEQLYSIRRNINARKLQNAYYKYLERKELEQQQVTKKSNSIDISLSETDDVLPGTYKQDSEHKVQEYLEKCSKIKPDDGEPISLLLEKMYDSLETKPFTRTLFFGDGIISFQRILKIPFRMRLSKTCILNSHKFPKSVQPKGLQDAL